MAAADTLITVTFLGAGAGIAAYVTNFMGFKAWADEHLIAPIQQPPPPPPTNGGGGGGGGGTEPPIKNDPPPRPGTSFNCVSYPRCNTVVGTDARKTCCCKNKCALIGRTFKSINFRTGECFCNPPPSTRCTYSGCTHLNKGPGCYQCRCSGICKAYPNTHPVTKADGSCTCPLDPLAACQKYCKTGGGTAKIVNGNCQCTAPSYYCQYSGCANEKTRASCFMCRCRGICRSRPGTYPSVDSAGSCHCRAIASVATVRSYNIRPHEALDESMMQVPTLA